MQGLEVSKALDITFLSLRDLSLEVTCICCLGQTQNLFMSSTHYISSPHHFFSQILKWVAVKVINNVPREKEKSSSGGTQGHANAAGQGGSRKFWVNRESHPTVELPAEPASLLHPPAEPRGGFLGHTATPQNWATPATTPSCSWSCPQESLGSLAHAVLIKGDKIKVSYVSRSKLFHVSTMFSYTQLNCNQDSKLLQ